MLRLLSSGLVVFAGVACAPATVSPGQFIRSPAPHQDARLEAIRGFFERTRCPASEYSQAFLDAADDSGLDWRLLPSISFVESTGGKAAPYNNIFGWDNGQSRFSARPPRFGVSPASSGSRSCIVTEASTSCSPSTTPIPPMPPK